MECAWAGRQVTARGRGPGVSGVKNDRLKIQPLDEAQSALTSLVEQQPAHSNHMPRKTRCRWPSTLP